MIRLAHNQKLMKSWILVAGLVAVVLCAVAAPPVSTNAGPGNTQSLLASAATLGVAPTNAYPLKIITCCEDVDMDALGSASGALRTTRPTNARDYPAVRRMISASDVCGRKPVVLASFSTTGLRRRMSSKPGAYASE